MGDLVAEDRERHLEFPGDTEVSKPPKCMADARHRVSWLAAWRRAPRYANFRKGFLRGVPASEVEGKNRQSSGRVQAETGNGGCTEGMVWCHQKVKHKAGSVRR